MVVTTRLDIRTDNFAFIRDTWGVMSKTIFMTSGAIESEITGIFI